MYAYKVLTWYVSSPRRGITRRCRRERITAYDATSAAMQVDVPGNITKIQVSRISGLEPMVEFRGRPVSA